MENIDEFRECKKAVIGLAELFKTKPEKLKIAERVYRERFEHGWSYKQIGEGCGVSEAVAKKLYSVWRWKIAIDESDGLSLLVSPSWFAVTDKK